MNKQTILGLGALVILVLGATFVYTKNDPAPEAVQENNTVLQGETGADATQEEPGKLKAANFEGTLTEVNMGCTYDAECYAIVDGKHITILKGWHREVSGPADLDELSANIGKKVEVYAHDLGDGTYTLYGSEGFYVRLKN